MMARLQAAALSQPQRPRGSSIRGITTFVIASVVLFCSQLAGKAACAADSTRRPNVVVILADDLGYSDLGCYGSEIETPNLDKLAAGGLRFTQFYNTARCWPTRAAILTGYYAQQVRRDTVPGVKSGGAGVRPAWARLLPEMLKPLGYRSYHSGKWHVDGMPLAGGFDHSYYVQDLGRYFSPKVVYADDQKLPPVQPASGYYTTVAMADAAIGFLKQHAAAHSGKPFFQYLAFNAPHFPLQALPEDIARYRDKYRDGWQIVRRRRYERMRQLGIVDCALSAPEREVGPPYDFPDAIKQLGPGEVNRPFAWEELTEEQRGFQADKMAIHAAMVDRMDREIGRVFEQIRAMGAWDDTLIFFLSDNGASAEIMVRDDGHDPAAPRGSAASHLCLGPGWSTVANTPFRRHKTWVHEGGISTPLVVHWPRGIAARGQLRRNPGHVIDLVPTILAAAGGNRFETWEGKPVPPPPGKSLLAAFAKDGSVARDCLWWQHEGNRAVRAGDWKLVAAGKDAPWELYDLSIDRAESQNLAGERAEKARELEQLWTARYEEFRKLALSDVVAAANPGAAPAAKAPAKTLILPGEAFEVAGRPAFVMMPTTEKLRRPQPWILYAPTLPGLPDAHEKWMHEQFLDAGVAVAGIDVGEAYGGPAGREGFDALYRELTEKRGFAPRPCLLGRSRGGLWVSSWAIHNPGKVAGIAGIYPVFDLRTYPGLEKAAPAYGLSPREFESKLSELNPIERVGELAAARVPAFFIHGDKDDVVPLKQNSAEFVRRYQAAGAGELVRLEIVAGQGHNYFKGFFRCQALLDFAIARANAGAEQAGK